MSARLINLLFFLLLSLPLAWYSFKLIIDGVIVTRTNYESILNPFLFFGIFFSVGSTRFSDIFKSHLGLETIIVFIGVGGVYLVAFYIFRIYRSGWKPILHVKNVSREQFMKVLEEVLEEHDIEHEGDKSEIYLTEYDNFTLWILKSTFNKLILYCEDRKRDAPLETILAALPDRLMERTESGLSYEGLLSLLFIGGWSIVILGGYLPG
jgi:hypothetical protein